MRTESFTIEYPNTKKEITAWNKRYGLNAIYAGKHWTARKEDSQFWHIMVSSCMNRVKIPHKLFDVPVEVTIYWNDNLDIDNHSYMGKMIVDSLKGRLLRDDSRKYLSAVQHKFWDKQYILVCIQG